MENIQNKDAKTTVAQDIAGDDFLATIQDRLVNQSDAISSSSTNIESTITKAIKGIQQSNQSSTAALESAAGRQIEQTRKAGSFAFTGAQEEQRGFATNVGILKKINEDTNTNIKDLEQRKQELILQGQAEAASQISALQLKSLEFKQQAQQQVFTNLLAMSNFGLSVRQEKRQQKAQDFTERQAISNIALEFGIESNEDDTIDTIVAKAAPLASEERRLKLEQIKVDIANSKAQTAKALRGDPSERPFDPLTALTLAQAYRNGNTEFLGGLKTNEQSAAVYEAITALEMQDEQELSQMAEQYSSPAEFNRAVDTATAGMTESQKALYKNLATKVAARQYTGKPKQTNDKIVGGIFSKGAASAKQQQESGASGGVIGGFFSGLFK